MPRSLRVLIVDDHPLILEGIANLLRSAQHHVVGTIQDPAAVLPLLTEHPVDVVTLDIGMPVWNGMELARQIHDRIPRMRIVFVTQHADAAYLRAAMQAGANAFVSKQSARTDLLTALEAVGQGRSFISPLLRDVTLHPQVAMHEKPPKRSEVLTSRQREVLQQIAEGRSVKQIAAALDISTKTVEFHKQGLVNTLGIRTTAELTRYAIAHGMTFL